MFEITGGWLIEKTCEFAASEALERLRERANTTQFIARRNELAFEAALEMGNVIRELAARLSELEQEEVRRRVQEDQESMGILANYLEDIYREPLDERRRMLAFAGASMANLNLTVPQLARVQRVLRELDPDDVVTLYGLMLIPNKTPWKVDVFAKIGQGGVRMHYWNGRGADALAAAGAIRFHDPPKVGGPATELILSNTAWLLLHALRPYIRARRPDLSDVPWHEVTPAFRSEDQARELLKGYPGLEGVVTDCAGGGFSDRVMFTGVAIAVGAPANGKATISVRGPSARVGKLWRWLQQPNKQLQEPVHEIWVECNEDKPDGDAIAIICGPHDVLRWLAYDVDALWI